MKETRISIVEPDEQGTSILREGRGFVLFHRHVWRKYRNRRDSSSGLPWYRSVYSRDNTAESLHHRPHSGSTTIQSATRILSAQDVSILRPAIQMHAFTGRFAFTSFIPYNFQGIVRVQVSEHTWLGREVSLTRSEIDPPSIIWQRTMLILTALGE